MPRSRPAVTLALALTTLAVLPGCLITSSSSSSFSGNRVDPGAESQVVLFQTGPDQAATILGEPTTRVTNDAGEEVLTWRWTRQSSSSGSVFLIFGGSSNTTQEHALNIAFRDGVAVRRWRQ